MLLVKVLSLASVLNVLCMVLSSFGLDCCFWQSEAQMGREFNQPP